VVAVATGAIGGDGGTVLRGEAVVALEKGLDAVIGQIVFGVQPLGGVAAATDFLGNLQAALERFDFVLGMAVSANGGVTIAGGNGPAMDAGGPIGGFPGMAAPAGLGLRGPIHGGRRRVAGEDVVGVVAILAGSGVLMAGAECEAVNAGVVKVRLAGMADGAVDGLEGDVVVRMAGGGVGMATDAGIGVMNGRGEMGLVNKEGNDFAGGVGFGEGVIAVAVEAVAVGQGSGGVELKRRKNQGSGRENDTTAIHPLIVGRAAFISTTSIALVETVFGLFNKSELEKILAAKWF